MKNPKHQRGSGLVALLITIVLLAIVCFAWSPVAYQAELDEWAGRLDTAVSAYAELPARERPVRKRELLREISEFERGNSSEVGRYKYDSRPAYWRLLLEMPPTRVN